MQPSSQKKVASQNQQQFQELPNEIDSSQANNSRPSLADLVKEQQSTIQPPSGAVNNSILSNTLLGKLQGLLQTNLDGFTSDQIQQLGDQIILSNNSDSNFSIDSDKLRMYENVADELIRIGLYKLANHIYTIMIKSDQQPKFYIQRSKCYQNENKYIEATEDLQIAAELAPNTHATISSEVFYYQMEHYYRDLDIKFW